MRNIWIRFESGQVKGDNAFFPNILLFLVHTYWIFYMSMLTVWGREVYAHSLNLLEISAKCSSIRTLSLKKNHTLGNIFITLNHSAWNKRRLISFLACVSLEWDWILNCDFKANFFNDVAILNPQIGTQ